MLLLLVLPSNDDDMEREFKEACPFAGITQIKFAGISQTRPVPLSPSPEESVLFFGVGNPKEKRGRHPDAFLYSYLDLRMNLL
jgi:hypothetical protein